MKKKYININILSLILIIFFSVSINQFYGNRGLFPHDSTAHFDTGYRILLGDFPVRDYWIVSGFFIDYFQAFLFKFFGTNWQVYVFHASLLNMLFVIIFYFYFKSLKIENIYVIFFCICISILGYTSSGTPFVDHHSTFISIVALILVLLEINNKNLYLLYISPFLFLIAFLSKPVPAAYIFILTFLVLFYNSISEKNYKKIINFLIGTIISISVFFLFLFKTETDFQDFYTQYILYSQEIGRERFKNFDFDLINTLHEFKFLLISALPLLFILKSIFKKNLVKNKKFYSVASFLILTVILIFYQLLTKNQIFIFFLIPVLVCMSKDIWQKKKLFTYAAIIFTALITLKYHDRYNNKRKFHEMQKVDFSKTIEAEIIDKRLSGLNWITPGQSLKPKEEITKIIKIRDFLKNREENYMLLTNYSFFSVVLEKNNYSFTRWFVGDGTDFPRARSADYKLRLKKMVIKKIKEKNIKNIFLVHPVTLSDIEGLIKKECLEKNELTNSLTKLKLTCQTNSL